MSSPGSFNQLQVAFLMPGTEQQLVDGVLVPVDGGTIMASPAQAANLLAQGFNYVYSQNDPTLALPTTLRPTGMPIGFHMFDTTLNLPVWWNGTGWFNAAGVAA